MASKSISKYAMWILMGLLALGLGGFSVTNFGGGVVKIGTVGATEIGVNDYNRGLRSEINAITRQTGKALPFSEAQAQGIPQRVLSGLVLQAALEDETARMGISVGDATLLRQIKEIPGFQGADGEFEREGYRYALESAGLSEAEFEEDVRTETASMLVQNAVISGVNPPEAYTDTLLAYIEEKRDVTYTALARSDLTTGLPVPSEADLQAYYQAHLPAFTTPKVKRITYAWMTPEMIIDDVKVPEATLKEAYDSRLAEFQQPERRLVERLVYPDSTTAQEAKAKVDSGEASFDDLVEARGLSLHDVDMGDVEPSDLGTAGDVVFAAETGAVVGPLDSDLGPALFRVNAVLEAQNTSFEEAEPQLRDELAGDRAARVVDSEVEHIDDLLASGATIENLKDETRMQVATIDWHPGMKEGIAAYEAFRNAAEAVQTDDYPEVAPLGDGGIFALRLDEVLEPTVQPFADVQSEVTAAWAKDALIEALRTQADTTVAALRNGASFEDEGLTPITLTGVTRQGFQAGTPQGFIPAVFAMAEGAVTTLAGDARLLILRLDAITAPETNPDESDGEVAQIRQSLREQAANGIAQDIYQALADDIRNRAGITLDQQAINAVHANFQ